MLFGVRKKECVCELTGKMLMLEMNKTPKL